MIGHLLNTDLDVHRPAFTGDGRGGRSKAFDAVGSIRAQLSQPSDQERATAEQLGDHLDYVVHTTPDADVQRGDELDDGGDRRLRVVGVVHNSRSTYKRLHATVVQGG